MTQFGKVLALAVGMVVVAGAARADGWAERREWRHQEWRHAHEGPRGLVYGGPVYVAPAPVYVPPPVYYAPPVVVVPPVFGFGIRVR